MKSAEEGRDGSTALRRLIPLTKWSYYHDYPSISGLRHLVFTMPVGFEKVVRRVNRRVLLDEAAWFAWVEEQNQGGVK